MMRSRTQGRDQGGAVAVITAVMATMLLVVAAMSVDLGNAWARKQEVQKQVDLAALAGGQHLPADSAEKRALAVQAVLDYLNSSNNSVTGQSAATVAALTNGVDADGEVEFDQAPNSDVANTLLRVVAPKAWVDFTLANAAGFSGTHVAATATVQAESELPHPQDVLPFALPAGCPYGPGLADTGPNGGGPTPTDGVWGPNTTSPHTFSLDITSATKDASVTVNVAMNDLKKNFTEATLRFHKGTADSVNFDLSWTNKTTDDDNDRLDTITIGTGVTGTAGVWKVWVEADKYSSNSVDFTVTDPLAPPDLGLECATSYRGNYGQMDSPRNGVNQMNQRFGHNIAKGLDHVIDAFPPTPSSYECAQGNAGTSPISDALLDKDPDPAYANCLNISSGNDGAWVMNGLVTGVDGAPGRVSAARGNTTCGGTSNPGDENGTINGTSVNDDRLACFLLGTATLNDLVSPSATEGLLSPDVTDSPRFVWIPVVWSDTRVNYTWQPIKYFVPAFITAEGAAVSHPADDDGDGIVWSGNQVTSIQIFAFNPNVLPEEERSPTTGYNPAIGRATPRLVN